MSRTLSPSSGKSYGLARACRVWRGASRASVDTASVALGPTLEPLGKGVQDHGPPPVRRRKVTRYA